MNIFITGKPGCGKSTLINSIINNLKEKNRRIAGIITPEIRKGDVRYGFKIIDLMTEREEVMASIDIRSYFKVSKYNVSVENIDKIVDVFLKSYDKADICIIDEAGKMEFYSEKFRLLFNKILNNDKINIIAIGLGFLNEFRSKGEVFYLERDNFDEIEKEILNKINLSFIRNK